MGFLFLFFMNARILSEHVFFHTNKNRQIVIVFYYFIGIFYNIYNMLKKKSGKAFTFFYNLRKKKRDSR